MRNHSRGGLAFRPLGVVVVDSRGALRAYAERAYAEEDGNPFLRSRASGKAFGSVAFAGSLKIPSWP
jgi:hypothetical protein